MSCILMCSRIGHHSVRIEMIVIFQMDFLCFRIHVPRQRSSNSTSLANESSMFLSDWVSFSLNSLEKRIIQGIN